MFNEIKPLEICKGIENIKKDIQNDNQVKNIISIEEKSFNMKNKTVIKGFLVKEELFYRKKIRESFYWVIEDINEQKYCCKSSLRPGKQITSKDIEKNLIFLKKYF